MTEAAADVPGLKTYSEAQKIAIILAAVGVARAEALESVAMQATAGARAIRGSVSQALALAGLDEDDISAAYLI
jgi:hypothetical protein